MGCAASKEDPEDGDLIIGGLWGGVGTPGYLFPEQLPEHHHARALQAKADLCLCLSGGGNRASTNALGYLRGFHALGLLPKIKYVASNSGGSWFSIPFSFQEGRTNAEFLGAYVAPEKLTPHEARAQPDGGFAAVLSSTRSFGATYEEARAHATSESGVRAYSQTVGQLYLKAHGLDGIDTSFCLDGATGGFRRGRGPHAPSPPRACRQAEMPFPIMVGTILSPSGSDYQHVMHPLEFTPLYCGCPAAADGPAKGSHLGGVLLEPHILNSKPPAALPKDWASGGRVDVRVASDYVVPLCQVAGISSCLMGLMGADDDEHSLWRDAGLPSLELWSPASVAAASPSAGARASTRASRASASGGPVGKFGSYGCADGARYDNLAIYPGVRRRCKKLMICFSCGADVGEPAAFADAVPHMATYFGASAKEYTSKAGSLTAAQWNELCAVFPRDRWEPLVTALRAAQQAGGATVARIKLPVLPNAFMGVEGGYEVDTVWLLNGVATKWHDALPADTKAEVERLKAEKQFPYISATCVDWEPLMVGALSSLSAWAVRDAAETIKDLVLDCEIARRALQQRAQELHSEKSTLK